MIYKYQELSSKELYELIPLEPVIFIPNSPMEVHGPHLPLGADIIQAENLAIILAEEGNKKFPGKPWLIYPSIPIGVDTLPRNGSVYYKFHTLVEILKLTGNGLLKSGIKSIIFTNFHGGMRHVLAQDVAADYINKKGGKSFAPFGILFGEFLQKEFSDKLSSLLREHGFDIEIENDIHAGAIETSLIMAIGNEIGDSYKGLEPLSYKNEALEIVSILSRLKNYFGIFSKDINNLFFDLGFLAQASTHFKKHSYSGDPARADIKIGQILLKAYTEKLGDQLEEFILTPHITGEKWKSIYWKNRKMVNNKIFDLIFSRILGNK